MSLVPVPVPIPSPLAVRYHQTGNVLWIVETLWSLVVPTLILVTGFSARLRTLARRGGTHWYAIVVIYVALFTLITFAMDIPLDYYSGFVRPHQYGLSSQLLSRWIRNECLDLVLGFVAYLVPLSFLYTLFRYAEKRWWLYTWIASVPLLLVLIIIQPIWIDPLFTHFGPLRDSALASQILALAHRAGIDGAHIYVANKSVDTHTLNAYVTGIGDTKRIVLWDTIIKQLPSNELLFVMGHEMGHYVLKHSWKIFLGLSVLLLIGLWLLDRITSAALRRDGTRMGVSHLADVASLPLLMLVFNVLNFVAQPVTLAYSRHFEHEADRFALDLTHDNHACAMTFVDLAQHDLGYPRPGILYTVWRSSHPSLGDRITFCNDYHPWLDTQKGRLSATL